jgi:hypothetical protein
MVELQLVALYGFIATLSHIGKHGCHSLIQLRNIQVRTLCYLTPL